MIAPAISQERPDLCPLCQQARQRALLGDERFESCRCPCCGYIATTVHEGHTVQLKYYESVENEAGFKSSVGAVRSVQMECLLDCLAQIGISSGKLLDIGCGYGWLLTAARQRGFSVYGIEPSRPVEELEASSELRVLRGFFPQTRFEGERFDVVAAIDVIEHIPLPELKDFLKGVRAALQPSGVFVVKVPDASGAIFMASRWIYRLTRGRCRGPIDRLLQLNYRNSHISYFTERSLRGFLEQQGFSAVAAFHYPELTLGTIWNRVGYEKRLSFLLHVAYAIALVFLCAFASASGRHEALILMVRPRCYEGERTD